jgi:hypothetical protein
MRAEEGRDDLERLLGRELLVERQNFELAREIEAIAALGLDGGGPVLRKPLQEKLRPGLQVF